MHLLESLTRLLSRFRYPVSLPEDVAHDLGMHLPNTLSFKDFIQLLSSPHHRPVKIRKYMPRELAEAMFKSALRKETFKSSSLFSYYFNKGWLVITLHYDEEARLRRAYLQCPACTSIDGFDLPLDEEILAQTF
ncbi:MAG: hypothetical protein S4CHLAM123_05450 [Chlamydiales bacterium]|nr:hypothetical protein [Chlamydiales bacterium]